VFAPLDPVSILDTLTKPQGWVEAGAIIVCFAVGWLIDRRVRLSAPAPSRMAKFGTGSVNRLLFPLTTLVLLLLVRSALPHAPPPVLLPIFIPLVVALACIRLIVYALRTLFGDNRPLPVSERTVAFVVWGALLLYYLGLLDEIGKVLEGAELTLGKTRINLLELGRDALIVLIAILVSVWLSGFVEQRLLALPSADRNLRAVTAKFVRAVIIVLGVLIALPMLGIDLTVLSVFGGALGVGIGLGLQKLASNYIAGFTILLDRSIRLGDMITVDNRFGVVSKVTSRYVVVRSLDGIEAIVPNETLVTTTVLNHSYTTRDVRVAVPIQISYGSDVEHAIRLMADIASQHRRVLRAPLAPNAQVLRCADSGIDLELGVWINDPENGQGNLRSELYLEILKAFKSNDIQIPYPRRDIYLKEGTEIKGQINRKAAPDGDV
jgi:small-conductance mechanosensitive channel